MMKRPAQDRTKVSITEKSPDVDQLSKADPAQLARALVKYTERRLKTKQNRQRGLEKGRHAEQREEAQRLKSIAFKIAARLIKQDRTLRFSKSKLAEAIKIRSSEPLPSGRTLRRWLAELTK